MMFDDVPTQLVFCPVPMPADADTALRRHFMQSRLPVLSAADVGSLKGPASSDIIAVLVDLIETGRSLSLPRFFVGAWAPLGETWGAVAIGLMGSVCCAWVSVKKGDALGEWQVADWGAA